MGIAGALNRIIEYAALGSVLRIVLASSPSELPRVEQPLPVYAPTVPE
jgi:hypothetical protein